MPMDSISTIDWIHIIASPCEQAQAISAQKNFPLAFAR